MFQTQSREKQILPKGVAEDFNDGVIYRGVGEAEGAEEAGATPRLAAVGT